MDTEQRYKKMAITKDDLQKLKDKVPHGGLIRIADKLKCSKDWVYKVLSGKLENVNIPSTLRVIEAALEVIEEMEQQQQLNQKSIELKNRIKKLTDVAPTNRSEPALNGARHKAIIETV